MKKLVMTGLMTALILSAFAIASAEAKNCGSYRGHKLVTHGVTCRTAKKVFKRYDTGRALPDGWICSASAGICERSSSRYFTFRLN